MAIAFLARYCDTHLSSMPWLRLSFMLTITSRGCIFFLSPPPHFGVVTLPRERTSGTSDDYRTAARVRCLLTRRDDVAASGANDEDPGSCFLQSVSPCSPLTLPRYLLFHPGSARARFDSRRDSQPLARSTGAAEAFDARARVVEVSSRISSRTVTS